VWINLLIFAFNLLPIPPLDGGRIMTSLLPNKYAYKFAQLEPYGFFIVMALIFLNLSRYWIIPVVTVSQTLLGVLVSPLTLLLN
jgi:Zn-dependent protease